MGKRLRFTSNLGSERELPRLNGKEFRLKDKIPRDVFLLLESEERYSVRVGTLLLDQERSGVRPSSALARRGGASKIYWQQLIRDARSQVAREEQEW